MKLLLSLLFFLLPIFSFSQSWSTVANGINGQVNSFAIYNDELYMAGKFKTEDGNRLFGIVKWNGVKFDTLPGTHLFGGSEILDLVEYQGELYFCGYFFLTGGTDVFRYVARWDGNSFHPLGWGCNGFVRKLKVYKDNLYVGGDIDFAGSMHVHGIASWDGQNWSDVDEGLYGTHSRVYDMTILKDELYVGGQFNFTTLDTKSIAKWNDTIWSEVGDGGIPIMVYRLGTFRNNLFAVVLGQSVSGEAEHKLVKWSNTFWKDEDLELNSPSSYLPEPERDNSSIHDIQEYNGELYIGGVFNDLNGEPIKGIARFDGNQWRSVGAGVDSSGIRLDTVYTQIIHAAQTVQAMIEYKGELYVGGDFNMIGGIPARNIAKWKTDKPTLENSIQIFPNPTTNSFSINSPFQIDRWSVFDTSGKVVFDKSSQDFQLSVNFEDLSSGVYYIKLQSTEGVSTKKIMKL